MKNYAEVVLNGKLQKIDDIDITHLIQDWNCCTPESPCKTENTGDCDDHGDCHGDMLCGTNNCGADDVTGFGKIVATLMRIYDHQATWIAATGNIARQTVNALLLGWSVNHITFKCCHL